GHLQGCACSNARTVADGGWLRALRRIFSAPLRVKRDTLFSGRVAPVAAEHPTQQLALRGGRAWSDRIRALCTGQPDAFASRPALVEAPGTCAHSRRSRGYPLGSIYGRRTHIDKRLLFGPKSHIPFFGGSSDKLRGGK